MVKLFQEFTMKLPVYYEELSSTMRRQVREEYVRRQKGRCQVCNQPLDGPPPDKVEKAWIDLRIFPPGMFDHPIHLHHSKETGLTIGAVHARCNAYIFQYKGI